MKITKPEDLSIDSATVETLIEEFEKELSKVICGNNYYFVQIFSPEKRTQVLDKVREAYLNAGWATVECHTNDNNNAIDLRLYRHPK